MIFATRARARVGVLSVGGQEMRKRALLGWACRIDRWICTWDVAHVGMIPRNGAIVDVMLMALLTFPNGPIFLLSNLIRYFWTS